MNLALMIVGLALVWAAITGNFTALNLLLGAGIGALTALLLRNWFASPQLLRRVRRINSLFLLFMWELMVSAVRVAIIVITPNIRATLRPGIIAFPLTVKSDFEITLLANMITLTPGTLSVDVAEDRSVLYVHALQLDDREVLIAEIAGGFERKIQEAFI
ncbi:Na+/H+ antiporter subunit E [Devosia sp.]|uniref:Na+/H+ antiporter subunit E n=1 Tax=Devosia sp. TaxID=1871048 RepID=UPI0027330A07|nr:Na+/H+ antiporter subunit E [Devosia sp.]MDP2781477.1 Na+/H+ antiporter subunit E [Devosia sp.]